METMKAIWHDRYGGPEVLQYLDLPIPKPKAKEILLKVEACTITQGDCEMRDKKIFSTVWFIVRLFFGLFKPRQKILGGYVAGEIVEVGNKVTRFKPGQKVFGITAMVFGGNAEYVAVTEKALLIDRPDQLSPVEAAPAGLALDSAYFLEKIKLKKGEKILINGAAGAIGGYALQMARNLGAEVTAVDSGIKLDLLKDMGAHHVIDYTNGDLENVGEKYDVIFDVVSGMNQSFALSILKPKGRYITAVPEVDRALRGLWVNAFTSKKLKTGLLSATEEDLKDIRSQFISGSLKTYIDQTISLEKVPEAHRYIQAGKKKGNIVIDLSI